jgi:MOSC domain-containing protein YiiM
MLRISDEKKMARLLSINVGLPRDIPWQGKTVHTGVWKTPVQGRRMVRRLNVDGDGQGDLQGHGGEHRAVFVYQIESYRYWRTQLGRNDFVHGSLVRISRLMACPTPRCASATVTGSGARYSK